MASRYIKRGSTSNPEVNAWGAAAMLIKSRLGTAAQATSVGGLGRRQILRLDPDHVHGQGRLPR